MKSRNQFIQSIVYRRISQQFEHYMQPGVVQNVISDIINKQLARALNDALKKEMDESLERKPYERTEGSIKRNGYKETTVPSFGGSLILKRPVVRKGTLRLPLLDALKQIGKDMIAALASAFWFKGTSTRDTATILKESFGAKISAATVSNITNALEPEIRIWESRPIPSDIIYVFVDALYLPVSWRKTKFGNAGFTTKQALLCGLGIDSSGTTHFLGHLLGDRENTDSWETFLDGLIKRGLNISAIRLVISDEHQAIINAVSNKLGSAHQYCIFHKMKNASVRIPAKDRDGFMNDFKEIFWANSKENSLRAVGILQGRWQERYPRVVDIVTRNLDNFLMFMNEPKERWKNLRTSNKIERFNREIRRRLRPAGTIHSELELSKILWSVSSAEEETWRNHRAFRPSKEVLSQKQVA
jgi:transposase-like protein